MRKLTLLSSLSLFILLLASCSKSELIDNQYQLTEVNVIASRWISEDSIRWFDTSIGQQTYKHAVLQVPDLTEDMITNGAILVYCKKKETGSETSLPYSLFDDTEVNHDLYKYEVKTGFIDLLHTKVRGGKATKPSEKHGISYRYIFIQDQLLPNTNQEKGKAAGFTFKELKEMKYSDVVRIFGISK